MNFDFITWGIWLVGLIILVVWIFVPIKEIKRIIAKHKSDTADK